MIKTPIKKVSKKQSARQYQLKKTKVFLLERAKNHCEFCGKESWLEVHHIIFRSRLGSDKPENLIMLCQECHRKAQSHKISKEELYEKINEVVLSDF